ncbi:MAG: hypothetical protein OQK99_02540 [Gammaproteobacteria bacterium]|jgi:hypothetical protein|nr:hypothetical protein [Gammaproteobacteria bacterium]
MRYRKMVLSVLLLIISGAISRTDDLQARVPQWQNAKGVQGVAAVICPDEQVLEAVDGRVLRVRVSGRDTWSTSQVRQCGTAGNIESKLDVFFSNAHVVMLGAIFETATGLRLDSALRNLIFAVLRLASVFVPLENPGSNSVPTISP